MSLAPLSIFLSSPGFFLSLLVHGILNGKISTVFKKTQKRGFFYHWHCGFGMRTLEEGLDEAATALNTAPVETCTAQRASIICQDCWMPWLLPPPFVPAALTVPNPDPLVLVWGGVCGPAGFNGSHTPATRERCLLRESHCPVGGCRSTLSSVPPLPRWYHITNPETGVHDSSCV